MCLLKVHKGICSNLVVACSIFHIEITWVDYLPKWCIAVDEFGSIRELFIDFVFEVDYIECNLSPNIRWVIKLT